MKTLKGIIWILFLVVISAGNVFAHKVIVFAWVDGNTINTESKFHGGKMAQNARVEVYGPENELLVEGETDTEGLFSFPVPKKCDLKIVTKAGTGHQGEWKVEASELSDSSAPDTPGTSSPVDRKSPEPKAIQDTADKVVAQPALPQDYLTAAEVDRIVNAALDKKMKPVTEKLSRLLNSEHSPGIPDILGGIGYILGLVGVGAYVRYRKTEK